MPAPWRTSDLTVLVAAGVGTVALTGASFLVAPPDALPRSAGSTYATHPDGARAAFLLLKGLGYQIDRSFEPVAALRHAPDRTVLVLANPSEAPSDLDVRALQGFIERGGVVLATGPVAASFLPGVPQRSGQHDAAALRAQRQDRSLPSGLTAGVESIDMVPASLPLPSDSPYAVLYGSEQAPAVVTARLGRGRAVWWAGSAPLANGGIGRPQHVELLVNMLGPPGARTVLWDEFYHGHTRSFWSYLAGTPVVFMALQMAGIAAAALFTYARRRRPMRPRVIEPRTSPLEFIDTMGGLYARAGAAAATVATVHARVRRLLLLALGLPPSTSDDRLAVAAAERLQFDRAAIAGTLARATIASANQGLTAHEAVPLAAELQGLAARIEVSGRGRKQR